EEQAATLRALGVDAILEQTAGADELRAALTDGNLRRETAGRQQQRRVAEAVPERPEGAGSLLAGVGSRGAAGASECAASLAALAAERWSALLVECDLLGGGLDLRLAADAHDGSLLGLVRAGASGDGM